MSALLPGPESSSWTIWTLLPTAVANCPKTMMVRAAGSRAGFVAVAIAVNVLGPTRMGTRAVKLPSTATVATTSPIPSPSVSITTDWSPTTPGSDAVTRAMSSKVGMAV